MEEAFQLHLDLLTVLSADQKTVGDFRTKQSNKLSILDG
jgi:hypothetical protein